MTYPIQRCAIVLRIVFDCNRENALDALERGVVPAVSAAIVNFPDNEDILLCSSRILYAISEAVKEEMDR